MPKFKNGDKMDIEELLRQAKENIQNAEVMGDQRKEKKAEYIEDLNGHYFIPNSKQPYKGDVIKLSSEEFNAYFQRFSGGMDEYRFRDKLDNMDAWLYDKPYRIVTGKLFTG